MEDVQARQVEIAVIDLDNYIPFNGNQPYKVGLTILHNKSGFDSLRYHYYEGMECKRIVFTYSNN